MLDQAAPAEPGGCVEQRVWKADQKQSATGHGCDQNVCKASVYNLGRL